MPRKTTKAASGVTATVETIHPKLAEEILARADPNRNLSRSTINRYADEMAERRWELTGEALVFSKTGRLLDGQHRLAACVETGVPFETVVVKGINEDGPFFAMGQGKRRNGSDVLAIHGETSVANLNAACRVVHNLTHGRHITRFVPNQDILATITAHPGIRESCSNVYSWNATKVLPCMSPLMGIHYLLKRQHGDCVDTFWETLCTGEGGTGEPEDKTIFVLRRRFEASRIKQERTTIEAAVGMVCRAFSAWNDGIVLTKMHIPGMRSDGAPDINKSLSLAGIGKETLCPVT